MKITKLLVALVTILVVGTSANAQTKSVKIAHINSNELLEGLPQVDTINIKLEAVQNEYKSMLEAINKELASKQEFWKVNPTTDPSILEIRQKDYEQLATRYQSVQQEAQQIIAQKQAELYEPLYENLKKLIQEVAVAQGYNYVIDSSEGGGMIYGDPAYDLMAAVKEKLKTAKL